MERLRRRARDGTKRGSEAPAGSPEPAWRRAAVLLGALCACVAATAIAWGAATLPTDRLGNAADEGLELELMSSSAGGVRMVDSRRGTVLISRTGMVPGDLARGTIQVRNTRGKARVSLRAKAPKSPPGPRGGKLSQALKLKIRRYKVRGPKGKVWAGKLAGLRKVKLGTWKRGMARRFVFIVSFPDTGTPAGPRLGDNRFQRATARSTVRWQATPVKKRK